MKLLGIWLLLMMGTGTTLMAQSEASAQLPDSNSVMQLIQSAEGKEVDSAAFLLEKAIFTATRLKYTPGVISGYEQLLQLYRANQAIASELRNRLKFENYLEQVGQYQALAKNAFEIGNLYAFSSIYEKAKASYVKALQLTQQHQLPNEYAILRQLAAMYQKLEAYQEAETTYQAAIKIARQRKLSSDLLWLYQQLGAIAHAEGKYDKAFQQSRHIFELADTLKMRRERIIALNNMGFAAKYTGNSKEAEQYFQSVLTALEAEGDMILNAKLLQNLAVIHQNNKQFESAADLLIDAAELYHKLDMKGEEARVNDLLALVYYQSGDAYNALVSNELSIYQASTYKFPEVLMQAYNTKSLIHQALDEYEKALVAFKQHLSLKDSIMAIERERQNKILQQQFLMERLEQELTLFYVNQDIKDLEIAKLSAEKEAEAERVKAVQQAADLEAAELRNKNLQAKQALDALRLSEELLKVEKQQSQITLLNQKQQIDSLELEKERLNAQKAEEEKERLEQQGKVQDLELQQARSRTRNLIIFTVGLAIIIIGIILALLRIRTKNRQISQQNEIIEQEKDKSDKLLLNILPMTVAEELKEKGKTTPQFYESVSVVFTDFVGFTNIAERLTPEELVETLDQIFLKFDLISEQNGLNRIKTIGDAYMCACGLPEPDQDHAAKAVWTSLAMRNFIQQFNKKLPPGHPTWDIRIGVNSGSVVAGVVGQRKFAYDIWGDAVNIAARMESTGEIGKVNISGATYEMIKDQFKCIYRGKVHAKNKGDIDMYFVDGMK